MTEVEKFIDEVFRCHNKLRTDPTHFVSILENRLKYFNGKTLEIPGKIGLRTNEGEEGVQEAIDFLKEVKPVPAISISKALCKAAQDHADDCSKNNITGHDGSDGSSMGDRINRYGKWDKGIAENCAYNKLENGAHETILDLLIDDGVASRGHRKNMFDSKSTLIGIGYATHETYGGNTVLDYAVTLSGVKDDDHTDPPNVIDYELPTIEYKEPYKPGVEYEVTIDEVPPQMQDWIRDQIKGMEDNVIIYTKDGSYGYRTGKPKAKTQPKPQPEKPKEDTVAKTEVITPEEEKNVVEKPKDDKKATDHNQKDMKTEVKPNPVPPPTKIPTQIPAKVHVQPPEAKKSGCCTIF